MLSRRNLQSTIHSTVSPPADRKFWTDDSPINKPISDNPILDTNNAAIVSYISSRMATGTVGVLDCSVYGSRIYYADDQTPRVEVGASSRRDPSDFPLTCAGLNVPLDPSWVPAPGTDGHLSVIDVDGMEYSFWALENGVNPKAGSAGVCDTKGKEITSRFQGSTATRFGRAAGLVRMDEWERGYIDHAIFIATSITKPGSPEPFRFPATDSDGKNLAGAPLESCLEEGTRIQLDPTFDVDAMTAWQPWHRIVAKAMQTYGVYVGDTGGALFSIPAEIPQSATGTEANAKHNSPLLYDLGIADRYAGFPHDFPWSSLRVLARWGDTVPDEPTPKISTLKDDFTSAVLDRAFRWGRSYSPLVVQQANQVVLEQKDTYECALTSDYFDCRDDAIFAKISPAMGGNGSYTTGMQLRIDKQNLVSILIAGATIALETRTAGMRASAAMGTYDATVHAWLRLRESNGEFYADTSPDGEAWTSHVSLSHSWPATSLQLMIVTGYWKAGAPAANSYVAAVNIVT